MTRRKTDLDVKMCNCAACNAELLGESMRGEYVPTRYDRPGVAGRLEERPYCKKCLAKLTSGEHLTCQSQ